MILSFHHKERWTQNTPFYQEGYFARFTKSFSLIRIKIIFGNINCFYQHIAKTQLFFGFFILFSGILIVSIFSEMLKQCAKRACYNTLQKHDLLTALPFEDNKFDCLISVAVTTYLSKYFLKINGKALIRPILFIYKLTRNQRPSTFFSKLWLSVALCLCLLSNAYWATFIP